jgi:hypothetical protein
MARQQQRRLREHPIIIDLRHKFTASGRHSPYRFSTNYVEGDAGTRQSVASI